MYKCEKNVTCNFGEVSFMKKYCIESKEFLKESRMLWDLLDENGISLFNIMYLHYLRYCCNVHLAETKKKQAHKRTSSKWDVRKREIRFCDMCTTNSRTWWFEVFVSVYCLSRYPDVNCRLNVSSNFYM